MLLSVQDEACYDQGQSDFSDLPDFQFDWEASVYGNVHEDTPEDIPAPLGNIIKLSHYVDANLYHDMTSGCSVTGIVIWSTRLLLNGTPRNKKL